MVQDGASALRIKVLVGLGVGVLAVAVFLLVNWAVGGPRLTILECVTIALLTWAVTVMAMVGWPANRVR